MVQTVNPDPSFIQTPASPPTMITVNNGSNNDSHFYRMVIVTAFVILVAVIGYIVISRSKLMRSSQNGNPVEQPQKIFSTGKTPETLPSSAPSLDPNKAWLKMQTDKQSYAVGEPITLTIKGFSETYDVNGFDLLLGYDESSLDVGTAQSLHPSFQLFQFKKEQHVTITGIKQASETNPTVFTDSNIISVTLTPKKAGKVIVSLLPVFKNEKTKFVDANVQVIVPQTGSVELEIR